MQPRGRRSNIEIIADILRLLRLGKTGQTEVTYTVKISREQSLRYLNRLQESGLLEEVKEEIGAPAFRITPKGLELLAQIDNMQEMLPPEGAIDVLHRSKILDINVGHVLVTREVADLAGERRAFGAFVQRSLDRHRQGDWGEMPESDKHLNDRGLERNLQLFSTYESEGFPEIWIITEADRSYTTVMFPDEYSSPQMITQDWAPGAVETRKAKEA